MTKILSFDPATKTLAYVYVETNSESLTQNLSLLASGTVDLTPGIRDKDISTVQRVRAVVNFLTTLDKTILRLPEPQNNAASSSGKDFVVLVEYQQGHNAHSRIVVDAILAYFATRCDTTLALASPSLKNKVARLGNVEFAPVQEFYPRYSTNDGAHKAHAKHNAALLVGKKMGEHESDALMQVAGWLEWSKGRSDVENYW